MASNTAVSETPATFGAMLAHLAEFPGLHDFLRGIDRTILFDVGDPNAAITATFKRATLPTVEIGEVSTVPDLVIETSPDVASGLLLGSINPFLAVDDGSIRVSGDPTTFFRVLPALNNLAGPVFARALEPPPREQAPPGH